MIISKITARDIAKLKPLFDKSAGYNVDIEEEISFFNTVNPGNWFYAADEGNAIGYIRSFEYAGWGTLELFVDSPHADIKGKALGFLIDHFLEHSHFTKDFRLRFELNCNDNLLIEIVQSKGFTDRIEHFLHYEINLTQVTPTHNQIQKACASDTIQVRETIENLHSVTDAEVLHWIESNTVYIYKYTNRIVVAAQVYEHDDSAEINRIATHKDFLKKGFAYGFLTSLHLELKQKNIMRVYLKVDQEKVPAQKLYEKSGYKRNCKKDQIWLSKIF